MLGYVMVDLRYTGPNKQTLTIPGEYKVDVTPGEVFKWPEKWVYKLENRKTRFVKLSDEVEAEPAADLDLEPELDADGVPVPAVLKPKRKR